MEKEFTCFDPGMLQFLEELSENNNRDWFEANRHRYENDVVAPAFDFIREMGLRLAVIAPVLRAEAKKVGGSLFRIYRDVRFSKDKRPYKTHVGIRFPHRDIKKGSSPGYYLHVSPEDVFAGVGHWHPDRQSLLKIRRALDRDPEAWRKVSQESEFQKRFELVGDSLKRTPREFSADHELAEDLKRKDFIAIRKLKITDLLDENFVDRLTENFVVARPFLKFICTSQNLPF